MQIISLILIISLCKLLLSIQFLHAIIITIKLNENDINLINNTLQKISLTLLILLRHFTITLITQRAKP